jgi:putative FmdB family regulatory protein
MPFYEYSCEKCGEDVTIRHGMEDTSPQSCPICGSGRLTRVFSGFSIARSEADRTSDLSWIDRDVSRRLRTKADGKLSNGFRDSLDRLDLSSS